MKLLERLFHINCIVMLGFLIALFITGGDPSNVVALGFFGSCVTLAVIYIRLEKLDRETRYNAKGK